MKRLSDLHQDLAASSLRRVLAGWDAARQGRIMPSWRDVDPSRFPGELEIVWAWRWDSEAGDFVARLAGEAVTSQFGRRVRGRRLADVFEDEAAFVRDLYRQVIAVPIAVLHYGRAFSDIETKMSTRLILPLRDDEGGPGGVFGATIFALPHGVDRTGIPLSFRGGVMERYAIDAA